MPTGLMVQILKIATPPLRAYFLLKIIKAINFQQNHYGAFALTINLLFFLKTMLEKRHQLLIALSRDVTYLDDVELVFPRFNFVQSSSCSQTNKNKPWLPVANIEPGLFQVSVNIWKIQQTWNSLNTFVFLRLKKDFCRWSLFNQKNFARKP